MTKYDRYNASEKGRARTGRYNVSDAKRAADERYRATERGHFIRCIGGVRRSIRRRESWLALTDPRA